MKDSRRLVVCSRSFSVNPQLRAAVLEKYDNVLFNDLGTSLANEELARFLQGAELAIVALEKVDEELLSKVPTLKVIGKYGVGTDKISFPSLKKHQVAFGWKGGVNKRSVSELVLASTILMLRQVTEVSTEVKAGQWKNRVGLQLTGKKIGIVGLGHIGQDLCHLLKPFGCEIWAHDIEDRSVFAKAHGVHLCSTKEEFLSLVDVLTIHVPLNDSTRHLISESELKKMKATAVLVNAARGGIVDEAALCQALKNKMIAAAMVDVLEVEPPVSHPLFELDNFFVTPHIGGSSKEAVLAMGLAAIEGLEIAEIPK